MLKITLIILLTTNIWLTDASAQPKSSPNKPVKQEKIGCKSDYSIKFVKFGQREPNFSYENNARVWLKLTNKSRKVLEFKAFIGQNTKDYVENIGEELNIYYEAVEKEDCDSEDREIEELPIGYRRVETYFTITLKPERSFVFSVAQQYLLPKRAVYITYECSQKCKKDEKGELKKAYFFASDLPKSNEQDK